MTSEKQAPSALDYLGSMQQAVDLEHRASKPGTSTALRDVLGRCIAEYNRMCSNKRHKIDTDKKKDPESVPWVNLQCFVLQLNQMHQKGFPKE